MDLIAFYADNSLIKKATSAEDTPTPGYLYHEIVGITHKSVEACQNLENVLISRLEHESPVVKLKALRTIKHILQKGHVSVKRDLMGRVGSIRPCLHARGAPDPLRGDSLWQSVRTEAQDVITIIFDTEQRAATTPTAISSMGSEHMGTRNYSSSPYNNSSSSSNSESNSNYEAANANYISSSSAKSYSGSGSGGFSSTSSTAFSQDIKNKISSLPSKLMGSSRPSNELSNFGSLNAAVSHASSHTHASATSGSDWSYAPPTAPSNSGSDEEGSLVDDITNPSGNATLSFQALDQFCARCALLDQYRITELLIRKFESRTWQVRHKALTAIESLLHSSIGSVVRDVCLEQRHVFEPLLGGMQAATREKAKQVLTLLGVSIESLSASTTQTPTPIPSAQTYSPPGPDQSLSTHFDTPTQETAPSSLFAGLSITSSAPQAVEPKVVSPPQTQHNAPSLISIDDDEEKAIAFSRNTSLFSFLEASADAPSSPAPMRDLGSTGRPNENDDSLLIASSPGPSQLSLETPVSLQFTSQPPSSPLIDLGSYDSNVTSPDILSSFREAPTVPESTHKANPPLSTSQPVSPPSSFLADLMEAAPPSSLSELLQTPDSFLAPSAPSTSNILSAPSSSPFGPPPKVPMAPNTQLKPAASTIPQSALQHYPHQQQYPPPMNPLTQPAGSIRTTSSTSVYNQIYSVPRAVSSPTPSPSSSSSFNFVQPQKKGDAFGDLVSIQIKQMPVSK